MTTLRTTAIASAIALFTGLAGSAHAEVLSENFEGVFPAWESSWFGTHSDELNIYCPARNCNNRGNNPDGLWVRNADISFDAAFGASLSSFTIGIAGYVPMTLQAFDSANHLIFSQSVVLTRGAFTDPGVYSTYTINSTTGISKLAGFQPGNTSIDNLSAVTSITAVPEPETYALMLAGLGVLGFVARRRRPG